MRRVVDCLVGPNGSLSVHFFVERMFGHGIYTTKVSSKADDYVENTDASENIRLMIVNQVALGCSMIMTEASRDMQDAPSTCDSVRFSFHNSILC